MTTYYKDIEQAIIDRLSANLTAIEATWGDDDVTWPGTIFSPGNRTSWMVVNVEFEAKTRRSLGDVAAAPATHTIEGDLLLTFGIRATKDTSPLMTFMDNAADLFPDNPALAAGTKFIRFHAPEGVDPPMDPELTKLWTVRAMALPFHLYT